MPIGQIRVLQLHVPDARIEVEEARSVVINLGATFIENCVQISAEFGVTGEFALTSSPIQQSTTGLIPGP